MRLTASRTERTTAATDVLLSLSATGGIVLLRSLATATAWKLHLWSATFALIAVAAVLGAVYHGLVLPERPRTVLWRILTACLSTAISLFAVGVVHDAFGVEAAGVAASMLAAGAQAARNLHVTWVWEFDHNGIFHLIQAFGVILFCVGLSRG